MAYIQTQQQFDPNYTESMLNSLLGGLDAGRQRRNMLTQLDAASYENERNRQGLFGLENLRNNNAVAGDRRTNAWNLFNDQKAQLGAAIAAGDKNAYAEGLKLLAEAGIGGQYAQSYLNTISIPFQLVGSTKGAGAGTDPAKDPAKQGGTPAGGTPAGGTPASGVVPGGSNTYYHRLSDPESYRGRGFSSDGRGGSWDPNSKAARGRVPANAIPENPNGTWVASDGTIMDNHSIRESNAESARTSAFYGNQSGVQPLLTAPGGPSAVPSMSIDTANPQPTVSKAQRGKSAVPAPAPVPQYDPYGVPFSASDPTTVAIEAERQKALAADAALKNAKPIDTTGWEPADLQRLYQLEKNPYLKKIYEQRLNDSLRLPAVAPTPTGYQAFRSGRHGTYADGGVVAPAPGGQDVTVAEAGLAEIIIPITSPEVEQAAQALLAQARAEMGKQGPAPVNPPQAAGGGTFVPQNFSRMPQMPLPLQSAMQRGGQPSMDELRAMQAQENYDAMNQQYSIDNANRMYADPNQQPSMDDLRYAQANELPSAYDQMASSNFAGSAPSMDQLRSEQADSEDSARIRFQLLQQVVNGELSPQDASTIFWNRFPQMESTAADFMPQDGSRGQDIKYMQTPQGYAGGVPSNSIQSPSRNIGSAFDPGNVNNAFGGQIGTLGDPGQYAVQGGRPSPREATIGSLPGQQPQNNTVSTTIPAGPRDGPYNDFARNEKPALAPTAPKIDFNQLGTKVKSGLDKVYNAISKAVVTPKSAPLEEKWSRMADEARANTDALMAGAQPSYDPEKLYAEALKQSKNPEILKITNEVRAAFQQTFNNASPEELAMMGFGDAAGFKNDRMMLERKLSVDEALAKLANDNAAGSAMVAMINSSIDSANATLSSVQKMFTDTKSGKLNTEAFNTYRAEHPELNSAINFLNGLYGGNTIETMIKQGKGWFGAQDDLGTGKLGLWGTNFRWTTGAQEGTMPIIAQYIAYLQSGGKSTGGGSAPIDPAQSAQTSDDIINKAGVGAKQGG